MVRAHLRDQKEALRREILARRDLLTPAQRAERSAPITAALLAMDSLAGAEVVVAYACFRSEVMTHDLIAELSRQGKRLLLPKVNHGNLDLYEITDREVDLAPGVWEISEPVPERCRLASPDEVEFALVPGVAFDEAGHRLGYGGGFYDRLLRHLAARLDARCLVAAAFELQIVPEVPVSSTDVRVPNIITEERLIRAPS